MCSLPIECALSYRMCSLSTECVLLLDARAGAKGGVGLHEQAVTPAECQQLLLIALYVELHLHVFGVG